MVGKLAVDEELIDGVATALDRTIVRVDVEANARRNNNDRVFTFIFIFVSPPCCCFSSQR
jgi:hypothetical protein